VPDLGHRAVEAIDEILRPDYLPIEFAVEALDAACEVDVGADRREVEPVT
jgi:hypothetical protein